MMHEPVKPDGPSRFEAREGPLTEQLRQRLSEDVPAPRLSSMTVSDIVITRTSYDDFDLNPSPVIPCADAFGVIVQLMDFQSHRLWRGGELVYEGGHAKGALAITDLREGWQCHHRSPFDNLRFHIPFSHLRDFVSEVGRPDFAGFECPPGTTDDVILGLAQALLPALDAPLQTSRLFLDQINLALLTHLTQTYGGLHFPPRKKGVLAPWQERQATDFLAAHVTEAFTIAELAAVCQLSRSYFIKSFRQTFGRTPYRWLTEYRVGKAKEMLQKDLPLAEIAIACGFADQSHMTRVFSQIAGQSPGAWRKHNRRL
jgi:AraC family transcriptional regulator